MSTGSELKEKNRILTSLDGYYDNVIVMKPPMCFSEADADLFLAALRAVLLVLREVDLSTISHTPT